jgi:hypothetical protein
MSYADGHAETHKWHVARTVQPVNNNGNFNSSVGSNTGDIDWVAQHATVLK